MRAVFIHRQLYLPGRIYLKMSTKNEFEKLPNCQSYALATRNPEFPFLDFLALFWKNFGQFSAVNWQIFCQKKYWKLWYLSFFRQIICTWQTFSIFLAEFRQIFGKEEVFGRLLEFNFCFSSEFCDKFWRKTWQKSAKKVLKRREIGIQIYV